MKSPELVEQAKSLYVHEQLSFREIGKRLCVNEKTVRVWRKNDGNWDKEREAFLQSQKGFHEDLYEFTRELMASIRNDLRNGEKVDQCRLYLFKAILPLVVKPRDYEETKQAEEDTAETTSNTTDLAAIIAAAMNIVPSGGKGDG